MILTLLNIEKGLQKAATRFGQIEGREEQLQPIIYISLVELFGHDLEGYKNIQAEASYPKGDIKNKKKKLDFILGNENITKKYFNSSERKKNTQFAIEVKVIFIGKNGECGGNGSRKSEIKKELVALNVMQQNFPEINAIFALFYPLDLVEKKKKMINKFRKIFSTITIIECPYHTRFTREVGS